MCCSPLERPASARATEDGSGVQQAGAPPLPGRVPRTLGALAVMLLASSITEVKLGVPAVCIRLGLQVRGCLGLSRHAHAGKIFYHSHPGLLFIFNQDSTHVSRSSESVLSQVGLLEHHIAAPLPSSG